MTYLVIGRKGNGKGVYLMNKLRDESESREPDRIVITNEVVKTHAFRSYMHARGHSLAGRAYFRPTQGAEGSQWMRQFWRDRGEDRLPIEIHTEQSTGYLTYSCATPPRKAVTYLINEASDAFRAREWQKLSGECEWAMRTERHRHDEIYLFVQDEKLLDKTFLKLFNWVIRLERMDRRHVWGVRGQKKFRAKWYTNIDGKVPDRVETIPFDLELMNCYRTDGLGGGQRGAERQDSYGVPFWVGATVGTSCLVLGTCLAWGGSVFAAHEGVRRLDRLVAPMTQQAAIATRLPAVTTNQVEATTELVHARQLETKKQGTPKQIVEEKPRGIRVTSWLTLNGSNYVVRLSDGNAIRVTGSEQDGILTIGSRRLIVGQAIEVTNK